MTVLNFWVGERQDAITSAFHGNPQCLSENLLTRAGEGWPGGTSSFLFAWNKHASQQLHSVHIFSRQRWKMEDYSWSRGYQVTEKSPLRPTQDFAQDTASRRKDWKPSHPVILQHQIPADWLSVPLLWKMQDAQCSPLVSKRSCFHFEDSKDRIERVRQTGASGPIEWTGKERLSEANASTDRLAGLRGGRGQNTWGTLHTGWSPHVEECMAGREM